MNRIRRRGACLGPCRREVLLFSSSKDGSSNINQESPMGFDPFGCCFSLGDRCFFPTYKKNTGILAQKCFKKMNSKLLNQLPTGNQWFSYSFGGFSVAFPTVFCRASKSPTVAQRPTGWYHPRAIWPVTTWVTWMVL